MNRKNRAFLSLAQAPEVDLCNLFWLKRSLLLVLADSLSPLSLVLRSSRCCGVAGRPVGTAGGPPWGRGQGQGQGQGRADRQGFACLPQDPSVLS